MSEQVGQRDEVPLGDWNLREWLPDFRPRRDGRCRLVMVRKTRVDQERRKPDTEGRQDPA